MLHIVVLILKIIGIMIAILVGLIILLLCIVLFTPIRYRLTSQGTGDMKEAQVLFKVSWLLNLITAKVSYQEQVWDWQVRIAWIKLNNKQKQTLRKRTKSSQWKLQKPSLRKPKLSEPLNIPNMNNVKEHSVATVSTQNEVFETPERKQKQKWKLIEKFRNIFQKIKYTIKNIYDKIRSINTKKDALLEFLSQEVHKRALQKLKKEGLQFLKKLIPKKIIADIVLGFEDPSRTGQFLAGYSMVFAFLPEGINMKPDFERAVFEGKAMLKGYVRMIWLVAFIRKMIWDQDVRETYYDIKIFKFKEDK